MERTLGRTPDFLLPLLEDSQVTDLCFQSEKIFFDRGNGMQPFEGSALGDDALKAWVLNLLSVSGKSWDAKHPFVDCTVELTGLPEVRHRLHAVFPPVSAKSLIVSLRRLPSEQSEPALRWKRSPLFERLSEAFRAGQSVLVCGATGSGKTTLATDLLGSLPPYERIVALEDTPELAPGHPHFLRLCSRPPNADGHGEVSLRTLLRQTLRMRPDRIILGECRGPEVLDLLQALNTGHRGSLATLHANSARDGLRRVELLCLLAAQGSIPVPVIRELVAGGLQWVAHVTRQGPVRRISELWSIEGREGDRILMRPCVDTNAEVH